MSLSKVSRFHSSAPSMFTDSQPKTGTDSVPFFIDFVSNPKRFGRFTVSQVFKNGQSYSEPTFQVFKKYNSGLFEITNWNFELEITNSRNSVSSRTVS